MKPSQIFKRLGTSTLFWMLVCLAILDISLLTIRPLKYISTRKFVPIDQNPVISKVPEFLSGNSKPDVLVLGSSLPMVALSYADSLAYGGGREFKKNVRTYTHAKYFANCLSEKLNHNLDVGNLTVSGCMVSDAYLILEQTIAEHKTPKLVVFGIAPRDFVDNIMPACGQTPAFEVLANWTDMGDLFKNDVSLAEKTNYVLDRLWYFYRTKVDYRFLAITWAADIMGRPVSLYDAVMQDKEKKNGDSVVQDQNSATNTNSGDGFAESLKIYKMRYNPPNILRYTKELQYFEKLLVLCHNNKVACLVVNMPVTSENKALLSESLFRKYLQDTEKLAKAHQAKYIDLDVDKSFAKADFEDCVHVNETGAKKVVDKLVSHIDGGLVL